MPLINSLKSTTLKSLRYTGLGPAVQKDINNPPVYNSQSKEVEARSDDVTRINRAILFNPTFVNNTAQLNSIDRQRRGKPEQKLDQDIPRGGSGGGAGFGRFLKGLGDAIKSIDSIVSEASVSLLSSAVQTPSVIASTLAQVGAESGTHFVYGFGAKGKYIPGGNGHVLASLYGRIPISADFDRDRSELKNAWSSLTPKTGATHPLADGNLLANSNLKNPNKISAFDYVKSKGNDTIGDGVMRDFTQGIDNGNGLEPTKISSGVAKEGRLGLSKSKNLSRYTGMYRELSNLTDSDRVNMLDPVEGENFTAKDHIKFKFGIINPDEGLNTNLYFRAFLSSFTDNYQGSWNNTQYLGRADNFYTYQGFNRTISIGFKAAAFTRYELKPLYKKLVMLASTTAPSYGVDNGFMRGTLVTSTVGDYIVDQPGFISSVDYSWQTDYPWEVKLNDGRDNDVQQVPHLLDCTIAFTPIQRFAPQVGQQHYITNPNGSFLNGRPLVEPAPTDSSVRGTSESFLANTQGFIDNVNSTNTNLTDPDDFSSFTGKSPSLPGNFDRFTTEPKPTFP